MISAVSVSKKTFRADEQNRADVKAARADWLEQQPELDPAQLVFVDETATSTKLVRHYGRSYKNVRCRDTAPHGRWETTTFTAGLRNDGLIAPLVIDGAMNGRTFRAWVEQCLAPELKPGDIVIMDNLAAHKVTGVTDAIEQCEATLIYLPPYSPDFNPIEQAFAKFKALLRKASARSIPELWLAIKFAIEKFSPNECENYFYNSGYKVSNG